MGRNLSPLPTAFCYGGVSVPRNEEGLISLTMMWEATGRPNNKSPYEWGRGAGAGFIDDLAKSLNTSRVRVITAQRGKGVESGTWAHWQIALAYAKYLSHAFHRHVNEKYRAYREEETNPALKIERAIEAYERAGKSREWINRRFSGINHRKQLTSTMAAHNCRKNGSDNPFAEGMRSISLAVLGQTPGEIKESKGLAKSARTRDHLDESELISIE